jgi:hypothetical protein
MRRIEVPYEDEDGDGARRKGWKRTRRTYEEEVDIKEEAYGEEEDGQGGDVQGGGWRYKEEASYEEDRGGIRG